MVVVNLGLFFFRKRERVGERGKAVHILAIRDVEWVPKILHYQLKGLSS